MALYPLCRHGRPRREALTYAAATIRGRVADVVRRADLLTTLAIFGRLVHPDLPVLDLIGRESMKESPLYQEILEEGRVEGRREGQLHTGRAAIREVLDIRFGSEAVEEF